MRHELQPETLQVVEKKSDNPDMDATTACEGGAPSTSNEKTILDYDAGQKPPVDQRLKRLVTKIVKRVKSVWSAKASS